MYLTKSGRHFDKQYFEKHAFTAKIYSLLGEKEDESQKVLEKKMVRAARIAERMINQNIYNDIAQGR